MQEAQPDHQFRRRADSALADGDRICPTVSLSVLPLDVDRIVSRDGSFDFRTAHHVAGAVVRKLMDAGLGAHEATIALVDEAAREVAGRPAGIAEDEVAAALDPVRSVASRTVPGGTAPGEVRRMIEVMRQGVAHDEARVAGWRSRLIEAAGRRRSATEALAAAP